jgi:AsmA protein
VAVSKALKWIGLGAGAVVVLLALVAGGIALFFDPSSLKPQIEKTVRDSQQRTLTIDGPLSLTFWPSIGVRMGKTTLSEQNSPQQFLALNGATLSVKVLPLLSKRVEVAKVSVDGLQVAIKRDAQGVFNFDSLITKKESAPATQPDSANTMRFDIAGIELTNASLDIADQKTNTTGKITNLNFQSGRLAIGVPTTIDVSGDIALTQPKTNAKLAIAGGFLFDEARHLVEFSNARARLSGDAGPLTNAAGNLQAGFINIDTRTDAVSTKDLALDLKGNLSTLGKNSTMQVKELALTLSSPQAYISLNDQILNGEKINFTAKGRLNNEPFDIALTAPKLKADVPRQELVASNLDAKVMGAFNGNSANLKITGKEVDAKLTDQRIKVTGFTATGSAKAAGNELSKLNLNVPALDANLALATLNAQGIKLDAAGTRAGDAMTLTLDAANLTLAPGAAKSAPITGKASIKGKQTLNADFRIEGLAAKGDTWSAQATTLDYNAALEGRASTGKLTAALSYNTKQDVLALSNLVLDAQFKDAALPGGAATTALRGTVSVSPKAGKVVLKLAGQLDQSKVDVEANVTNFAKPNAVFTATLDKLDADRYVTKGKPAAGSAPAPASAPKDAPVDLSVLKTVSGSGTLRVGELKLANVRTSNVNLAVKLNEGRADITNAAVGLYGGTATATGFADANTNAMALKANLANVSVLPLLKDAMDKDVLEGKGTVAVNLNTKGATVDALKRALNGNIDVNLRDGAVKGVNLAQQLRDFRGKLQLGKNDGGSAKKTEKTDFSEMSAKFTANNGVLTASDVKLASPFLRATQGTPANIDLVGEKLDFVVRVTLVNTSTGQEGKTAGLKDLTIPVRLSGPFTSPGYDIQWSAVSSDAIKAALAPKVEEKKAELKDKLKEQQDKLTNRLGQRLGLPGAEAASASPAAATAPGASPSATPSKKPEEVLKDKLKGLLNR